MSIKRILSLMLAAAAVMSTAAGCGESSSDAPATPIADQTEAGETQAAQTETEATEISHFLPKDLDFGGYTFRWLTSATTATYTITAYNEQTGDVLNDSMYYRTKKVEEELNVKFADDVIAKDAATALADIRKTVQAGEDAFDASMQLGRSAFGITGEGLFLDMKTLPYLTRDAEWWFSDINDQVNLSDHDYIMFGSLNLGIYDMTNALMFNKNMLADLSMDDPYKLVDDGKWVFDKMAEMTIAAAADTDGDGKMGMGDRWGYAGRANSMINDIIAGTRQRTVEFNDEGIPELTAGSNERIISIFDKAIDLFWDNEVWYRKTSTANSYYVEFPFFENDQALFADRSFYSMSELRDMKSDFGILPFPKYDEAQNGYGTMTEAGSRTTVVPATIKDENVVGAVLEALNFYSWRDVVPVYLDVAMKEKYSRDAETGRMVDLVLDSTFYDLGVTMLCETVKDGIFVPLFSSGKRDLVSKIEKQIKNVNKAIDKALNS